MTRRVLVTITEQDMEQRRAELCRWYELNGLVPANVAATQVTVERVGNRQVIVYDEIQRSQDGRALVHPDDPERVWTVRRSSPLRVSLIDSGVDHHSES